MQDSSMKHCNIFVQHNLFHITKHRIEMSSKKKALKGHCINIAWWIYQNIFTTPQKRKIPTPPCPVIQIWMISGDTDFTYKFKYKYMIEVNVRLF